MTDTELHDRLLDEARNYNPEALHRSLLDPFRDVILLQRAKFISYEKIARMLTHNGVKISGPGVASYCRRTFTVGEVGRTRQRVRNEARLVSVTKPATGAAPLPPVGPGWPTLPVRARG